MSVIDEIYNKQPGYASAAEATPTGDGLHGPDAEIQERLKNLLNQTSGSPSVPFTETTQKPHEGSGGTSQTPQTTGGVGVQSVSPKVTAPTMNLEYVPGRFYEEFDKNDPYKQRLQDVGKELKRAKRQRSFAQLADGLSAFHRAYAHARGIQPMTLERNLTGKTRERYETLAKERDALQAAQLSGRMKAQQMDMEEAWKNRNWERTLNLDKKADKDREYKRKKEDEAFEYQKERDKVKDTQWQQQYEESKRQHNAAMAQRNQQFQQQMQRYNNTLRGKPLQFSAGGGNTFTIYQNVWSDSWPTLYDFLIQKVSPTDAKRLEKASPAQQRRFVESNWSKYPETVELMRELSEIDPAGEYSAPAQGNRKGGQRKPLPQSRKRLPGT